jgi:phage/plasmid-like protein (TIGR03299 family)
MAHNIAVINGRDAMAYQGETPWHKLGTVLPSGVVQVAEALTAASLDWSIGLQPMYLADGKLVPKTFAVVRDLDTQVLGTVSHWYKPIQYRDAFGIFQPAVEEFGLTVEAAGALGDGEKAWMLFKLPSTISPVPGDEINGYGVAITGHDGATACEFRPTPIRVVCQNTLNAAVGHGGRKGRVFSISHIGNVDRQIAQARELVCDVLAAMQTTGETFAAMARKRMTPDDVIRYIKTVFPTPEDGKESDQLKDARKAVSELVFTGVGADLAMSETGGDPNPWACYNAVTEYFDHVKTGRAKSAGGIRIQNQSALFGAGAEVKQAALEAARVLVAA